MGFDQYRSRPDLVGNRYVPFQNDPNAQFITESNDEKKNLIDISKAIFTTPKEDKTEAKKEGFEDNAHDLLEIVGLLENLKQNQLDKLKTMMRKDI
jgi:hypothetical protein